MVDEVIELFISQSKMAENLPDTKKPLLRGLLLL
jgi:hypothetical protein